MKQFILNLTEEEKADLQYLAHLLGISMEEILTKSIMQALEQNRTGVHDVYDDE